jgi:hypothetical protein
MITALLQRVPLALPLAVWFIANLGAMYLWLDFADDWVLHMAPFSMRRGLFFGIPILVPLVTGLLLVRGRGKQFAVLVIALTALLPIVLFAAVAFVGCRLLEGRCI